MVERVASPFNDSRVGCMRGMILCPDARLVRTRSRQQVPRQLRKVSNSQRVLLPEGCTVWLGWMMYQIMMLGLTCDVIVDDDRDHIIKAVLCAQKTWFGRLEVGWTNCDGAIYEGRCICVAVVHKMLET